MIERDDGEAALDEDERDALARLIHAVGRRPEPRAADYERVLGASRKAWLATLRQRRRRWGYALAAGVAVLSVGVALLPFGSAPSVATAAIVQGPVELLDAHTGTWTALTGGMTIARGARLRSVGDGRAAFELEHGVSLRVSSATEWTFARAARIELTAGTLYVDSGTGAVRDALEIVTPSGIVRDVGTQFEVRALSSGLRVRVREGRADFTTPSGSRSVATAAGEQLSIDARGAMQREAIATDAAEWSWTQSLAAPPPLEGRTAFEVLTWVARESGKRLVFADADVELRARSALLHGSSSGLLPLELLDVLVATTGELDYSLGEQTLTIRQR